MRAFALATSISTAFLVAAACAAQDSIPRDFRVVAHFGPGHVPITYDDPANGQIGAWNLRLDQRGVAKIEVIRHSPGKNTKTSIRYPLGDVSGIVGTVTRSRFFELPRFMDAGITDVQNYSLEVTMDGKTHAVRVASPGALRDKKLLRRFIAVWVAVCQRMPPQFDDGATLDLKDSS